MPGKDFVSEADTIFSPSGSQKLIGFILPYPRVEGLPFEVMSN